MTTRSRIARAAGGSKQGFHRASDGSIVDPEGRVLHFSIRRFVKDICEGDKCFICGGCPTQLPFDDEHVLPNWLLRRFQLHGQRIALPNLSEFRYDQYKVPCCKSCNRKMGDVIERPVSRLIASGYQAVHQYLRASGPQLFYTWLALIFFKTHFKDRTIRAYRDGRAGDARIADLYQWEELHHIHCIARSFYTKATFGPAVVGSFAVVPAKMSPQYVAFDYGDMYEARTVLVRIDDLCFIAVLNDACAALCFMRQTLARIAGPLSPIQLRELMAGFALINLKLKTRPQFMTRVSPGSHRILARYPAAWKVKRVTRKERGACLFGATQTMIDAQHPLGRDLRERVLEGHLTFLFDNEGRFIEDSLIPQTVERVQLAGNDPDKQGAGETVTGLKGARADGTKAVSRRKGSPPG